MTLSEALKEVKKRSKITYKKWGDPGFGVTINVVKSAVHRNECKISTLIRCANAAGYDVLLVRRHPIVYEEPIIIDQAGTVDGG